MKRPARDAIIPPHKLRDYLLSPTHPDGRAKADYLGRLGYSQDTVLQLEADLRDQVLCRDAGETAPRLVTLIPGEKP
jgi:hypothetical protein